MRYRYETRGIVLSRSPLGEANAFVTIITSELGLVRARVQGVRRPGAKLAAALATFSESSIVLVRGKEGWRIAGAILEENWFVKLSDVDARRRACRVSGLILRLVAGEAQDSKLYQIIIGFFEALATLPSDTHEAAEVLAALHTLAALGLDSGDISSDVSLFAPPLLSTILAERSHYISRINRGIVASGL